MPKKRFEELAEQRDYNPIAAQIAKDAARKGILASGPTEVIPGGRQEQSVAELAVGEGGELIPESPAAVLEPPLAETPNPRSRPKKKKAQVTAATERQVVKKFHLTAAEDGDLTDFINRLHKASGTKVPLAMLIRCCLSSLMRAEAEVHGEVRREPPPKQAATHDSTAYVEFEDYWGHVISGALSKMKPLR